jgi:tellurite resistance protein
MRRAATDAAVGARTGIQDPDLLRDIEALGFDTDKLSLLPLVPILQVAWADGEISPEERKLIVDVARSRNIAEGSPADQQLAEWLARLPPPGAFARADRLVAAMLAVHSDATHDLSAADLVKYCESVAQASGGIFGLGKVSAGERAAIEKIQKALKSR